MPLGSRRSRLGLSQAQPPLLRRVILRRRTCPESIVIAGLSGAASWPDTNAPMGDQRSQFYVSGIPRAGSDRPRTDPGFRVQVRAEALALAAGQAQAARPSAQATRPSAQVARPSAQVARPSAQVARPWDLGARWG